MQANKADKFDEEVTLLQSLATPTHVVKSDSPLYLADGSNGTWEELCPSEHAWHFRSKDGSKKATVCWPVREVVWEDNNGPIAD